MRRLPLLRILAVLAALLCGPRLAAQEHPNQQRGFRPDKGYGAGEFDVVNTYNGNLSLVLPIGQSYPLGAGFSYQLKLVYNSNVWDYLHRSAVATDGSGQEFELVEAVPNLIREAGVGWTLSFGRLFDTSYLPENNTLFPVNTCKPDLAAPSNAGWTYVDSSGAKHCFYKTLHEGEAATAGVFCTRDSSYLRLKTAGASGGTIEFPDGTIHTFANTWPTRLEDRFGNFLQITGAGAPPWQGQSTWTLTDSVGRVHRVNFLYSLVSSVELQTFGQTANGAKSIWGFDYALVQMIERPAKDTFTCFDPNHPSQPLPGCDRRAAVNLLTRVRPPVGNPWEMLDAAGLPAYNTTETRAGWTDPWIPQTSEVPGQSGTLASIRLPTRGRIAWDYMAYHLPAKEVKQVHRQRTAGVARRRLFEANGAQVPGEWTYAQSFDRNPPWASFNPTDQPREVKTTMTDPLGHRRVFYFWAQWSDWQFGLPITPLVPLFPGDNRFKSEEIIAAGKAVPLQTTFLAFDKDVLTALSGPENQDWSNSNRRVLGSSIQFGGGAYSDFTHADFDGLGHYRTTWRAGAPGNNGRTEVTSYNNGTGTYGQPGYQMWPVSSPWIIDTYIFTITQPGSVFRTYCWDPQKGVLKARRVHAASAVNVYQANDLIEVFDRDAQGNVIAERYFGGDAQSVGADVTWICVKAASLTNPAYQVNHTYAAGVRASSSYVGPGGAVVLKALDQDIDAATGLAKRSRDSAGLATDTTYDAVGRMTKIDPAQEAVTDLGYVDAAGVTPAKVTVTRFEGAVTYSHQRFELDGFGRVEKDEERMPNGSWSQRFTFYNALGWTEFVTEKGVAGPGGLGTNFINLDPLGRPGRIRPADGSAHDVDLEYVGVSQVTRKVKVATSAGAPEVTSSTTEIYDARGRLYQVTEPNGTVTRYEYDALDNLTRVCQAVSGSACGQERRFTYDNRGFLLWENHPEKTANVLGQGHDVDYLNYDARGNAGRRVDGTRDLTFAYDRAGRTTLVRQTGAGFTACSPTTGPRCWKEFTYATANAAGNFRQGKLETATRHNYVVLGTTPFRARVVETYAYGGVEGRVSSRTTTHYIYNGALGTENPSDGFSQSWQYTTGGEVASRGYPQCTGGGCFGIPARAVSFQYGFGRLTAVPGYANSITYHANGLVNQVAHSNSVTDTQAIDATNLMPRPTSFEARHTPTNAQRWYSGAYAYDGAGNVKQIGITTFDYDLLSRLTAANNVYPGAIAPPSGSTLQNQSYLYDLYGNLLRVTTSGVARLIPTDSATNRLCGAGCGGTAFYESSGNLVNWSGQSYEYDDLGMISRFFAGDQEWVHIYTADDERLWSYQVAGGTLNRWTLRDLDQKVLREYTIDRTVGVATLDHDYVYAGSRLLAAETPAGIRHYHPDHLGSPRLITNAAGNLVAFHAYYPFGEEATSAFQDAERMKFTGHERDLNNLSGTGDDLDYMHARFYSPLLGRFLRVDPKLIRRAQRDPRRLNRYVYTLDNPLTLFDPNGAEPRRRVAAIDVLIKDSISLGLKLGPLGVKLSLKPGGPPVTSPGLCLGCEPGVSARKTEGEAKVVFSVGKVKLQFGAKDTAISYWKDGQNITIPRTLGQLWDQIEWLEPVTGLKGPKGSGVDTSAGGTVLDSELSIGPFEIPVKLFPDAATDDDKEEPKDSGSSDLCQWSPRDCERLHELLNPPVAPPPQ